jgi:hypothetical protein
MRTSNHITARATTCIGVASTICLLTLVLVVSGCGDAGPPMGEVTGTVTVDGEPAQEGAISFYPTDGKSSTAGAAIKGGRYTAQVPVGESKVEIRVSKIVGHRKLYDTPDSETQPILEQVLPAKYNDQTELLIDVASGANEQNYDLESRGE